MEFQAVRVFGCGHDPGFDDHPAPAGHRVPGVGEQVRQDRFEVPGVDAGQLAGLVQSEDELDVRR